MIRRLSILAAALALPAVCFAISVGHFQKLQAVAGSRAAAAASYVPPANCILWYEFAGDTAIVDSSGGGLTGTNAGSVWSNVYGGCQYFDGADDQIIVPRKDLFDLCTNFTVALWVYPVAWTNTTAATPISKRNAFATMDWYWGVESPNSRISLHLSNSAAEKMVTYTPLPAISNWHHWAVTYSNKSILAFYDGVLLASTNSITPLTTNSWLRVGSYNTSPLGCFKGLLDDVMFYSRPLGSNEVLAIVDGTRGVK